MHRNLEANWEGAAVLRRMDGTRAAAPRSRSERPARWPALVTPLAAVTLLVAGGAVRLHEQSRVTEARAALTAAQRDLDSWRVGLSDGQAQLEQAGARYRQAQSEQERMAQEADDLDRQISDLDAENQALRGAWRRRPKREPSATRPRRTTADEGGE